MTKTLDQVIKAHKSISYLQKLDSKTKNNLLSIINDAIINNKEKIINANKLDLENNQNISLQLIKRLIIDETFFDSVTLQIQNLINLDDPVNKVLEDRIVQNGLNIKKITTPLGVIACIYEARPSVTIDCIILCIKTNNAIVLRGSSIALNTNVSIINIIKDAFRQNNIDTDFIQYIAETSHDSVNELLQYKDYIDLVVPRGNSELIKLVNTNATMAVLETGIGNCHIYVESTAYIKMAIDIIINAKIQKPFVCNSCESILIDAKIVHNILPLLYETLNNYKVIIVGCEHTRRIISTILPAQEDDYYKEYLDMKVSIKVINNYTQAVDHINKYGTKHSESIISQDKHAVDYFMKNIDSACVYHNASTRFTDGYEFGFGSEIGISTQKFGVRGPVGLDGLLTYKYNIYGNGQIRN